MKIKVLFFFFTLLETHAAFAAHGVYLNMENHSSWSFTVKSTDTFCWDAGPYKDGQSLPLNSYLAPMYTETDACGNPYLTLSITSNIPGDTPTTCKCEVFQHPGKYAPTYTLRLDPCIAGTQSSSKLIFNVQSWNPCPKNPDQMCGLIQIYNKSSLGKPKPNAVTKSPGMGSKNKH